jgi:Flp pilus assembly protein TadD
MPKTRKLPRHGTRIAPLAGLALLVAAALPLAVQAADTPEPAPAARPAADVLAPARAQLAQQRFPAAVAELKKVDGANNADWHNLMGYALRKSTPPDLDGAQRHYDTALRLNPAHQGALEYSGELALMKGDLATAEARLATLSRLCSSPCEALDDLKQAIAKYKAAGKR